MMFGVQQGALALLAPLLDCSSCHCKGYGLLKVYVNLHRMPGGCVDVEVVLTGTLSFLLYVSAGEVFKGMSILQWLQLALLNNHCNSESPEVLPESQSIILFTLMAVLAEATGASYMAGVLSSSDASCAFRMPSTSRPSGLKDLLGTVIWYCTGGTPSCKSTKHCSP